MRPSEIELSTAPAHAQLPAVPPAAEASAEGVSAERQRARVAAGGTGYGALLNSNSDPLITCTGV